MYPVFENGSCWVKVDFQLHTRADKEFQDLQGYIVTHFATLPKIFRFSY